MLFKAARPTARKTGMKCANIVTNIQPYVFCRKYISISESHPPVFEKCCLTIS
jgi:hypothetical protein